MKAYVSIESYMQTNPSFSIIQGNDEKELLSNVLETYGYGIDPDEPPQTIEDVRQEIRERNGDGTDLVISVITDQGKVLFHV